MNKRKLARWLPLAGAILLLGTVVAIAQQTRPFSTVFQRGVPRSFSQIQLNGGVGVGTAWPTLANSNLAPQDSELYLLVTAPVSADPILGMYSGNASAWRTFTYSTLATNAPDVANSVWFASNSIAFEGATADGFEVFVSVADPVTPDSTITIPEIGEAAGNFLVSTLDAGAGDISDANAVWGGSNSLVFEGSTADAFETILQAEDADTADHTFQLPDNNAAADVYNLVFSVLDTNALDVANSVWFVSNGMVWEGSDADTEEVTISVIDPTADQTYSFRNKAADTYWFMVEQDGGLSASSLNFPAAAYLAPGGAEAEDPLASDLEVVCYRYQQPFTMLVTEAVVYEAQVASAGATDYIGVAIYADADAGAQVTEGASVYAADGAALVIDLTDATLEQGYWYRLCASQNDVSAQDWFGYPQGTAQIAVQGDTPASESNFFGTANDSTGNADMPATTGAMEATSESMPLIRLQTN